jgi:hypothetical protein
VAGGGIEVAGIDVAGADVAGADVAGTDVAGTAVAGADVVETAVPHEVRIIVNKIMTSGMNDLLII